LWLMIVFFYVKKNANILNLILSRLSATGIRRECMKEKRKNEHSTSSHAEIYRCIYQYIFCLSRPTTLPILLTKPFEQQKRFSSRLWSRGIFSNNIAGGRRLFPTRQENSILRVTFIGFVQCVICMYIEYVAKI